MAADERRAAVVALDLADGREHAPAVRAELEAIGRRAVEPQVRRGNVRHRERRSVARRGYQRGDDKEDGQERDHAETSHRHADVT